MFNKFEAFGIGASVVSMAVALYLVNLNATGALLAKGNAANGNQSAVVVVGSEGNQQTALRHAIVEAANSDGTVRKLIVDDVILGNGPAAKAGMKDSDRILRIGDNAQVSQRVLDVRRPARVHESAIGAQHVGVHVQQRAQRGGNVALGGFTEVGRRRM